jgi:hypothetical protein
MAGKDRIEITGHDMANNGGFYRVLASNDLDAKNKLSILDSHFFSPGELLQIAEYVDQHRAKLESEAAAQWWRHDRLEAVPEKKEEL